METLIENTEERNRMADNAGNVIKRNSGAIDRTLTELDKYLVNP